MGDEFHERLRAAIEVPTKNYLWVPADAITFVPPLLDKVYGDGRSLFTLSSIHQRPAYWVIRGDSGWSTCDSGAPDDAPEFVDFVDDIVTDLEEQFGSARCGYSGSCLRWPVEERDCNCEECADPYIAKWPAVDANDGMSWGRYRWPSGFDTVDHPWAHFGMLKEAG